MRRLGLALAVLLVGAPASAQGVHPLRTWCNSPTMDYCASLLTWDYVFALGYPEEGDIFISATFQGFGAALSQGRSFEIETFAFAYEAAFGYTWDEISHIEFTEPGQVVTGREATNIATPLAELTVDNFAWIEFVEPVRGGAYEACVTNEMWAAHLIDPSADIQACYRVPEPSTYLLLLSGMFGVGVVGWRRRTPLA